MISTESILISGDNTDVNEFKCIKVLGNSFKSHAGLGEIIKATVYKRRYKKKIIKKKIHFCLIVGLRKNTRRKNGHYIKFNINKTLVLGDNYKFLGTRVYGLVTKEIRKNAYKKIISYAKGVV